MKVFISWSGDVSHKVAVSLRDWLPNVIQSVVPYVSSEDIDKGTRWSKDIAQELSDSYYGILCVTKSNLEAPWLNFEAGALSKSIESSNVSPLLFDLKRADVSGPILQFQSTIVEKEDIRKLLHGINRACGEHCLQDTRLGQIFEVWWPKLDEQLKKILEQAPAPENKPVKGNKDRTDAMIEEILELSRNQQRMASSFERQITETMQISMLQKQEDMRGHPAFRDAALTWESLKKALKLAVQDGQVSLEMEDKISRFEDPFLYLMNRFGDLDRQSRFGDHDRPIRRRVVK